MRTYIIFGFCFFVQSLCAQNLVPNPSFEDHDSCPQHNGDFFCTVWFNPTRNSPDYFNECWNGTWYDSQDVPVNMAGSEPAHTGVGYAGFGSVNPSVNSREYVSIKLADSLLIGSKYCVEFYVSLGDSMRGGTNMIGAHLSPIPDTMYAGFYLNNLPFTPQIEFDTVILDTTAWVKLSGSFIAAGGEWYLTIGVFKPDSLVEYQTLQGDSSVANAYYFIDDVTVWKCDTPTVVYPTINLFPNPNNGEFTITGNFSQYTQLIVFDMLGQKVLESPYLPEGNNSVPVHLQLAEGVYYYELRSPIEQHWEGKLLIVK